MRKLELLAPAKDLECGIAAIQYGADAVYIGSEKYGARAAAGNTLEDIFQLTTYAHQYWAKVYVTINTLLDDYALVYVEKMIQRLYEIGVDAIIIQDMGILELNLPPIPIFASTQCNNRTLEKVQFFENIGLKRVILARELSLEQIKEIRSKTTIDLEFFVHGALCVGYSGQCYLSYALGRRSGNRGECAQPCRKCYRLEDAQGNILIQDQHLLCLKDLNLSDHLEELIDAGITSFKIEGRLKDVDYIQNIVSYYRQKLDNIIKKRSEYEKASSGTSTAKFTPDPAKTFNRGYTDYFINGRKKEITSPLTPKSLGEHIGSIEKIGNAYIQIKTDKELHPGDGICFPDKQNQLHGMYINQIDGKRIFCQIEFDIAENTPIYRNHDHYFQKELGQDKPERKIKINMIFKETASGFRIECTDEDNNQTALDIESAKNVAQKPEQARETILKQLNKTGESEFTCGSIDIQLEQIYFIPVGTLNQMRRDCLEKIRGERFRNIPKHETVLEKNDYPYPEKTLSFTGNVMNNKATEFYKRHGVTCIERAAEGGTSIKDKQVMTTKYCLKYEQGWCKKNMNEPLYLINDKDEKLELSFDCEKCEMGVRVAPSS